MRFAGVCSLLTLTTSALAAQDTAAVSPGDRVRVTLARDTRLVGSILTADRDTLILSSDSTGDSVVVARDAIARLEVSRGRPVGHDFVVGAGTGFLAGAVVGLAQGDDPPGELLAMTAQDKALVFGVSLSVIGGVLGALWGGASPERWATVDAGRVRFSVAPHTGGVGIGLRIGI